MGSRDVMVPSAEPQIFQALQIGIWLEVSKKNAVDKQLSSGVID